MLFGDAWKNKELNKRTIKDLLLGGSYWKNTVIFFLFVGSPLTCTPVPGSYQWCAELINWGFHMFDLQQHFPPLVNI